MRIPKVGEKVWVKYSKQLYCGVEPDGSSVSEYVKTWSLAEVKEVANDLNFTADIIGADSEPYEVKRFISRDYVTWHFNESNVGEGRLKNQS